LKSAKKSYIIGQKGAFKIKKFTVLLIVLFMASAAATAISFNRIIYPIKTKDASGYILEQKQPPARIISADPSITEILFALNLKDKIVGVTVNCDYPEDAKKIEKIGKDKLDIKKIADLKPDLVLVNLDTHRSDMEKLRLIMMPPASGEEQPTTLEVFAIDPHTLKDIYNTISLIGTVTNKEHAAYSLLQRMKRRIEWVEARAKKEKRLRGVVVVKKRPLTVAGEGTYLHDLLIASNFIDISPRGEGIYPKMKRDDIKRADPEVIITSKDVAKNPRDIYNNRDFRKTSAGKNKKAISIDADVFLRPGPRIVQALEEMASFAFGWPLQETQDRGKEIEQIKE